MSASPAPPTPEPIAPARVPVTDSSPLVDFDDDAWPADAPGTACIDGKASKSSRHLESSDNVSYRPGWSVAGAGQSRPLDSTTSVPRTPLAGRSVMVRPGAPALPPPPAPTAAKFGRPLPPPSQLRMDSPDAFEDSWLDAALGVSMSNGVPAFAMLPPPMKPARDSCRRDSGGSERASSTNSEVAHRSNPFR
eukprot:CAMPEP_0174832014 /NCGR_PEP_ID=MMETSP1114-20130205/3436_1 /TAXON_ID=312471 /ORGANISM="Neobodo designis, Strain CCAP 1951/1" /LENGTH=191 /DNA_ID=CAMNT_0016065863 /DNA_START=478 /DNA_END=1053 /DNA_ORIENTATION=+